jgi:hypothetical protein
MKTTKKTNKDLSGIIFDGRTRSGRKIKRIAKILDVVFMILAYGTLSALISLITVLYFI